MSSRTTQRVEMLKKDFMKYHNNGYSIREIADVFQVDFSTVYNHLQEIADTHGVTRESLLERVSSPHTSRLSLQRDKTDVRELKEGFAKIEKDIDEIIFSIEKILLTTKE